VNSPAVILGGGLAGLSAGVALARACKSVVVLERDSAVGGLARTVSHGAFRFDLGGHRFFTKDKRIEAFLRELMGRELAAVPRKSQILLGRRYIDYPLKPLNAVSGLGVRTTARILLDYAVERLRSSFKGPRDGSLEEWVVGRFGRTMFRIYFKEYSEKVWGIECDRISMEWAERRIRGLSLGVAIRKALFGSAGEGVATLAEEFLYPPLGIGRIAERMREEIDLRNRVLTSARAERLEHSAARVERVIVEDGGRERAFEGDEFVSTIPLTSLVRMLHPKAPDEVLEAASELRYRDLVVVAVMVNRERVTDQTWIYVPDRRIPFSRIHEPTNWSSKMAPEGKTLLVAEHFCSRGDGTWGATDVELIEATTAHLERLGFIGRREVEDAVVLRIPNAYPLFEVGYRERQERICDYLARFENLRIAGRSGAFAYMNMDHAIASGIEAAEKVMGRAGLAPDTDLNELIPAGTRR
jgi:protoporphyrinogen oxidase